MRAALPLFSHTGVHEGLPSDDDDAFLWRANQSTERASCRRRVVRRTFAHRDERDGSAFSGKPSGYSKFSSTVRRVEGALSRCGTMHCLYLMHTNTISKQATRVYCMFKACSWLQAFTLVLWHAHALACRLPIRTLAP